MIAVSSGHGKLLRVSLELIDACMETSSSDVPLAVADADVVVKIQNQKTDVKTDFVEKTVAVVDTNNLSNIALQDDQSYHGSPVVSNGKFESVGVRTQPAGRDRSHHNRIIPHHLTPLEVGMYILLAVFCAAIAIFVASCFVYASKFRRQDYPLQAKAQSVQNAHDWVWLGKSNRQSVECGSEMNITTNPRSDICDDQFVNGTSTTSSKSRTRTMASGHLPPPGHPAHGSPPFQQVTPELIRYGPYQQSHRYHQQMLMHRPQRFLPATPMNQRLSPVYQNNNVLAMAEFERQQQEQLMMEAAVRQEEQRRMMMDRETSLQRRRYEDNNAVAVADADVIDEDDDHGVVTNVIGNPMESEADVDADADVDVEPVPTRPKIDSATFTKKAGALTYFDDEYDRGRLILPVGYPYYRNSSPKVSSHDN